jgi:DNA-binding response OmpR family regulator
MRVLVVDDELEVLSVVGQALERDGHFVVLASDVKEARAQLRDQVFDVVVLDVGLPDGSGLELCAEIRRLGVPTRIVLLTAQSDVRRRLEGFEKGADDFVAKPFAVAELRARVRAVGRRPVAPHAVHFEAGKVVLEFAARHATFGGREVLLTAREWAILEVLAGANGRVVLREQLLESVWGDDAEGSRHSLDVLVSRIRRKLGADVLRTVRGEGYTLGEQ